MEFKQPPDKPCRIAFFNRLIEMSNIQATALRELYTFKKRKAWMGVGEKWELKAVEELSNRMDEWLERIPPYRECSSFCSSSTRLLSMPSIADLASLPLVAGTPAS